MEIEQMQYLIMKSKEYHAKDNALLYLFTGDKCS